MKRDILRNFIQAGRDEKYRAHEMGIFHGERIDDEYIKKYIGCLLYVEIFYTPLWKRDAIFFNRFKQLPTVLCFFRFSKSILIRNMVKVFCLFLSIR